MHWLAKVAAMKGLGATPGGMHVYAALQRNVTRSTTPTQQRIDEKISVGAEYLSQLSRYLPAAIADVVHVDIGTGWMPTIPLLFYSVGVNRQVLCDIRANLSLQRVTESAILVSRRLSTTKTLAGFTVDRLPKPTGASLKTSLESLGITYRAPYLADQFVETPGWKVVTCTQVLLHLRYEEIVGLLRHVARAIRGGGLFVATVHLYDLYADTDPTLSRFNKYRYSEWVWDRLCTSRLMYFNRMTVSDYRTAFDEAGLRLIDCIVQEGTPEQRRELSRIRVSDRFKHVPDTELAAQRMLIVAEAAPRSA
jgi:hypothetical protein